MSSLRHSTWKPCRHDNIWMVENKRSSSKQMAHSVLLIISGEWKTTFFMLWQEWILEIFFNISSMNPWNNCFTSSEWFNETSNSRGMENWISTISTFILYCYKEWFLKYFFLEPIVLFFTNKFSSIDYFLDFCPSFSQLLRFVLFSVLHIVPCSIRDIYEYWIVYVSPSVSLVRFYHIHTSREDWFLCCNVCNCCWYILFRSKLYLFCFF